MAPPIYRHEQYEMLGTSASYPYTEPITASKPIPQQPQRSYGRSSEPSLRDIDIDGQKWRQQGLRSSRWRRIGNTLWLLEFGSWLLGFGSLAAIVGVLVRYNGRAVPSLAYGITLGALVSVLSTIATVFLTVPLAAGIGQARWIWFRKHRKLSDFELISDASRSPFSAFWLIVNWKGGVWTIFGAFFMIIILGVNPFVQQVIKYDTKPVNRTTATVPIANTYGTSVLQGGIISTDVDLTMKAAIFRGMLQVDANNTAFDVNPRCPTGDCTWSQYATLSVCGRCADLTSQLSPVSPGNQTGDRTTSLPNGLQLVWPNSYTTQAFVTMTMNNTLTSPSLRSIAFRNANFSLANVFTIVGQNRLGGPYASECVLQFCARNMTSSSSNGTFDEKAIGEPLYLDQDYGSYYIYAPDGDKNWTVEYETYNGLNAYFGQVFSSTVQQTNSLSPINQWPDDISQAAYHYLNSSSHRLDGLFNDISNSMSQHIRAHSGNRTEGNATAQESFVNVRWEWMILPLIVLAAVLVFLIGSMILTRSAGLEPWKESSTAVLFHGLDDESRASLLGISKKWEMDEVAESLRMQLRRVEGELQLRAGSSQTW